MESYWSATRGSDIRQGDYLLNCCIIQNPDELEPNTTKEMSVQEYDLIIVSQSCDLENKKIKYVALCPIYSIDKFEEINEAFKTKWNDVRKGRVEGLHLLASPDEPENNRKAMVVDFREIYSLTYDYVSKHAQLLGNRWRLKSPYLEHFSQTFARFFMRVGLPSNIPEFR